MGGQFGPVGDAELGEDVAEVGLDRRAAHEEGFGDLGVGATGGHLADHLQLGGGEAVPAGGGAFALTSAPEGVGDGGVEVEFEALGVCGVETSVAEGVAAEPLAVRLGRHEQPGQPGQAEPFLGAGDGAEEAGGFEVAAGVGGASGEHEQPEVTILGATPDEGCGGVLGVAKAALPERRSA